MKKMYPRGMLLLACGLCVCTSAPTPILPEIEMGKRGDHPRTVDWAAKEAARVRHESKQEAACRRRDHARYHSRLAKGLFLTPNGSADMCTSGSQAMMGAVFSMMSKQSSTRGAQSMEDTASQSARIVRLLQNSDSLQQIAWCVNPCVPQTTLPAHKQATAWDSKEAAYDHNYMEAHEVVVGSLAELRTGLCALAKNPVLEQIFTNGSDGSDASASNDDAGSSAESRSTAGSRAGTTSCTQSKWQYELDTCREFFQFLRQCTRNLALPAIKPVVDDASRCASGRALIVQAGGFEITDDSLPKHAKQAADRVVYRNCPTIHNPQEWQEQRLWEMLDECLRVLGMDCETYLTAVDNRKACLNPKVNKEGMDKGAWNTFDLQEEAAEAERTKINKEIRSMSLARLSEFGKFTLEDVMLMCSEARAMWQVAQELAELDEDKWIECLANQLEIQTVNGCEYLALRQTWQSGVNLEDYFPGKLRYPCMYPQLINLGILDLVIRSCLETLSVPATCAEESRMYHVTVGLEPTTMLPPLQVGSAEYSGMSGIDRVSVVGCGNGFSVALNLGTLRSELSNIVTDPKLAAEIVSGKYINNKHRTILKSLRAELERCGDQRSPLIPGLSGLFSFLSAGDVQDPLATLVKELVSQGGVGAQEMQVLAGWIAEYNEIARLKWLEACNVQKQIAAWQDLTLAERKQIVAAVGGEVAALYKGTGVRTGVDQRFADTSEILKGLSRELYNPESKCPLASTLVRQFGVPQWMLCGSAEAKEALLRTLEGLFGDVRAEIAATGRAPGARRSRSVAGRLGRVGALLAVGVAAGGWWLWGGGASHDPRLPAITTTLLRAQKCALMHVDEFLMRQCHNLRLFPAAQRLDAILEFVRASSLVADPVVLNAWSNLADAGQASLPFTFDPVGYTIRKVPPTPSNSSLTLNPGCPQACLMSATVLASYVARRAAVVAYDLLASDIDNSTRGRALWVFGRMVAELGADDSCKACKLTVFDGGSSWSMDYEELKKIFMKVYEIHFRLDMLLGASFVHPEIELSASEGGRWLAGVLLANTAPVAPQVLWWTPGAHPDPLAQAIIESTISLPAQHRQLVIELDPAETKVAPGAEPLGGKAGTVVFKGNGKVEFEASIRSGGFIKDGVEPKVRQKL